MKEFESSIAVRETDVVLVSVAGPPGADGPVGPAGPVGPVGATGPAFHPGFVAGRYYSAPYFAATGTTFVLVANTLYAIPFFCPTPTTFTEISVGLLTLATTGKRAELGIYANSASGQPGALEYDAGSTLVDFNSGVHPLSGVFALSAGWHWLAVVSDGAPGLRSTGTALSYGWFMGLASLGDPGQTALTTPFTFSAGTLPNPFGTVTYTSAAASPLIALRL